MRNDNNPTPWPPAPEVIETGAVKPLVNTRAGSVSLILAAVLPVAIVIRYFALLDAGLAEVNTTAYVVPSLLALLAWSISGFTFGIMGWRSISGKIGLSIAAVFMLFLSAWTLLDWIGASAP